MRTGPEPTPEPTDAPRPRVALEALDPDQFLDEIDGMVELSEMLY